MWVLVWVLWWFHPRGIPMGLLVGLGLRYRLLWFGVLGGGCMVRKWKWSLLALFRVPQKGP